MSFLSNAVDTLATNIGRAVGFSYGGPIGALIGQAIGDIAGDMLGSAVDRVANTLFGGITELAGDVAENLAEAFSSNYQLGFNVTWDGGR